MSSLLARYRDAHLLCAIQTLPHPLSMQQFLSHRQAISFARRAHSGQRRLDGRAYLSHPLAVLQILLSICPDLPETAYTAALLHDTIEDSKATVKEITEHFGMEVAVVVAALTRSTDPKQHHKDTPAAEQAYLAQMIAAHAAYPYVLLIKMADRLHNLETAHFLPMERRRVLVQETKSFYLPILHQERPKQACYSKGYGILMEMLIESITTEASPY